jgi:hypothetical protein
MSLNHPRCSSDRSTPFDADKGLLIEQISIKLLIALTYLWYCCSRKMTLSLGQ